MTYWGLKVNPGGCLCLTILLRDSSTRHTRTFPKEGIAMTNFQLYMFWYKKMQEHYRRASNLINFGFYQSAKREQVLANRASDIAIIFIQAM